MPAMFSIGVQAGFLAALIEASTLAAASARIFGIKWLYTSIVIAMLERGPR